MILYSLLLAALGLAGASVASEAEFRKRIENGRMLIRKIWSGEIGGQLWQATDLLTPAAAINAAWLLDLCPEVATMAARLDTGLYKYVFVTPLGTDDSVFAELVRVPDGWEVRQACRRSNQRPSPVQSQALQQVVGVLNGGLGGTLEIDAVEVEGPVEARLPAAPAQGRAELPLLGQEDDLLDELESMEAEEVLVPVTDELDAAWDAPVGEPVGAAWPWDLPDDDEAVDAIEADTEADEGVQLDNELEMGSGGDEGDMPEVTEIPLDAN